jgi:arylsulfatase A-like enzyme
MSAIGTKRTSAGPAGMSANDPKRTFTLAFASGLAVRAKYGPRGVLDCKASNTDDPTVDPRFGKIGKQVCKDTGPLTKARMLTIDDDIADRAVDFIKRQNTAGKPVFVWVNFTHMHLRTHTKPASIGQSGRWQSPYHDTMIMWASSWRRSGIIRSGKRRPPSTWMTSSQS